DEVRVERDDQLTVRNGEAVIQVPGLRVLVARAGHPNGARLRAQLPHPLPAAIIEYVRAVPVLDVASGDDGRREDGVRLVQARDEDVDRSPLDRRPGPDEIVVPDIEEEQQ